MRGAQAREGKKEEEGERRVILPLVLQEEKGLKERAMDPWSPVGESQEDGTWPDTEGEGGGS